MGSVGSICTCCKPQGKVIEALSNTREAGNNDPRAHSS